MTGQEKSYLAEGAEVADFIGDPALAPMVAEVIQRFQELGIIAHGIKRASDIEAVRISGVLNNCPDGGRMESYWTSGRRIFLSEGTPYTSLRTFDTTFFHYSVGGVALTTLDRLETLGIALPKVYDHATVTIGEIVPPEVIELIVPQACILQNAEIDVDSMRDNRQLVERRLLRELARVAVEGVEAGRVTFMGDF